MSAAQSNAEIEQWRFLEDVVFASESRRQALVGRGSGNVYKTNIPSEQDAVRFEIERALLDFSARYPGSTIDATVEGDAHVGNIIELAERVSQEVGKYLVGDKLTVGRAQKALNLYLKYLWCVSRKLEPPHCPFDGKVIEKLDKLKTLPAGFEPWTAIADGDKYRNLVKEARDRVNESLAVWELREWNFEALRPSNHYWASKSAHVTAI